MIAQPYLLFLGDAPDPLAAKVAQGIKDWNPAVAAGQLRLPGCKADMKLTDMTIDEAVAAGVKTLVIGVANRGGLISDTWKAVLKEALRKYSVVPVVTRVTKEEDVLGDYKIPKGTTIGLLLQSVHHREDLWPNPDKFDPTRFLEPNKVAPYTFLPFIDGPRNCLGQHLALLEGRVILAYLVKTFKFKTLTDREGEKHSLVVPIAPATHMRMLVE